MSHRSSRWMTVLSGVLTLTMTAACGSSTPSASTPGPSPAAGSSGAGQIAAADITIWHYWDGKNGDTFAAMAADYQKGHPEQHVTVVNVPNADLLTKVQTAAQTKTLPDVVIGDLVWVPRLIKSGAAADLKPLMGQDTWSDIYPEMLKFGSKGDAQYSIPVSSNDLAMIYNADLMKKAGLDPAQLPTTWDELKQTVATITAKTGKPGTELFTQPGDNGEGVTWNFQVNLWQAGGEFLNADNTAAAFNSDAGRKSLQYWVDLINAKSSPLGPWGAFEKGAAASAQEGSWMVGFWTEDQPFDFAVGPIPHPADGKPATNMGGEQAVVFSSDADKQKAAAAFLSWFTAPAQNLAWSETTGFLPVRQSVAKDKAYADFVAAKTPKLQPYVDALPTARARPATAAYPQVSLAFARQIEQALYGKKTVDAALADAETEVNSILKSNS